MTATDHAVELVVAAARAASDKLATQIIAFDVSERLAITDVFLLCSASNERQVGAIVDAIHDSLLAAGAKPARREGERDNRWVLLDYVDIGCELLSIRGYDPLNDAIDYARYVLPLVRQELAHRGAPLAAAAS